MLESKLLLGLLVSVFGGGLVVGAFVALLRWWKLGQPDERRRVPGWVTGIVERAVFTLMIAYEVDAVGAAIAGWLALKLASNWNRPGQPSTEQSVAFAFEALIAGLLSMGFAALGGRIAVGKPLWW